MKKVIVLALVIVRIIVTVLVWVHRDNQRIDAAGRARTTAWQEKRVRDLAEAQVPFTYEHALARYKAELEAAAAANGEYPSVPLWDGFSGAGPDENAHQYRQQDCIGMDEQISSGGRLNCPTCLPDAHTQTRLRACLILQGYGK